MADPNQMSLFPDIPARMDRFLDEKVILNRAGRPIDVSGTVWKIPDPTQPVKLDWGEIKIPSETVLTATVAYMKHLLRNFSVGSAVSAWYVLQRLWVSPAFQSACMAGEEIPYRAISEVSEKFEAHQRYRLFWLRHWFNWCCDKVLKAFLPKLPSNSTKSSLAEAPRAKPCNQPIQRKGLWSILKSLLLTTRCAPPE